MTPEDKPHQKPQGSQKDQQQQPKPGKDPDPEGRGVDEEEGKGNPPHDRSQTPGPIYPL